MKKYAFRISFGIAIFAVVTMGGWCNSAAAQGSAAGPFTQDQVDSGRESFAINCAECHNKDLSGASAPALAGKAFVGKWKDKTSAELYTFIRTSMPLCQGGILGNRTYAEIVAFLLWANGAQPGTTDFDGSADVAISAIASGAIRSDLSKSK